MGKNFDNFYVTGINYKKSSADLRGEFLFSKPEISVENLRRSGQIAAYAYNKTCLRNEFYITLPDGAGCLPEGIFSGFEDNVFVMNGMEAVYYVMRLSCGLDSVIAGENQILSQLKKCHQAALDNGTTDNILNKILNSAVAAGKRFRHESSILEYSTSLENMTVKMIIRESGCDKSARFLLVGYGEINMEIKNILFRKGYGNVAAVTRNGAGADDIKCIGYESLYSEIESSDIVVCATNAPHCIVKLPEFKVRSRPVFMADLAQPRNVDPEIGSLNGVTLYNLEDIYKLRDENENIVERLKRDFHYIIEEESADLVRWITFLKKKERANV